MPSLKKMRGVCPDLAEEIGWACHPSALRLTQAKAPATSLIWLAE